MSFSIKLQTLRRARGWSQEALAERLSVSRQSVSQWESGSLPELDNLVALADLFAVTLDSLVREPRPGDCSVSTGLPRDEDDAVTAFLIRAKRATYAGYGTEVAPTRTLSHDLRYEEGSWSYHDTYLGSGAFAGEEALWEDGTPFWAMNYVGRVVAEGFSGDFLKSALGLATPGRPYRGPALYQSGEFLYHSTVEGSLGWFHGQETIFRQGVEVYECRFHGGWIRD